MKKLLFMALVAGGLTFAAVPAPMLEFTSALGLDRVTTDITLTATIIRIVITITGPTTGTADTVIIIATIVTTIITDIKMTQDLEIRLSWLESNFEPAAF